jgi:hypothetical protein
MGAVRVRRGEVVLKDVWHTPSRASREERDGEEYWREKDWERGRNTGE